MRQGGSFRSEPGDFLAPLDEAEETVKLKPQGVGWGSPQKAWPGLSSPLKILQLPTVVMGSGPEFYQEKTTQFL